MVDKKVIKPEVLNSSVGAVLKYSFDTEKELEKFFLSALATFNKNKMKTKVIGKSIYVFKISNSEDNKNVTTTDNEIKL